MEESLKALFNFSADPYTHLAEWKEGDGTFCAQHLSDLSGKRCLHEVKKGDRHLLCGAPFGPLRQKVPVTFFPS